MLFCSLEFIFWFLPIFMILYYFTPYKYKNTTLLVGSLFFYAFGEPVFVVILLFAMYINYLISLRIRDGHNKKWLVGAIIFDVGILVFFKYTNFLIENINAFMRVIQDQMSFPQLEIPFVKITLPIGISFYTFQMISYMVDVYKGKIKVQKSFMKLGTYICMFPQLIAGPIVLYKEVCKDLSARKYRIKNIEEGTRLFIIGLASKVLIADKMGLLWHEVQTIGFESISTPLAWLGALAFSIQIYFDFNGYSLMAIGLGNLLGFSLPQNFKQPYAAKSVTEFWQRWHITLGRWFKEYVYFPLGGNRGGKGKTVRNLFLVWLLTGLWHGAEWNFVLWGMVTFLFIIIEKAGLKKWLDRSVVFSRIYMLAIIPTTWILFAITNINEISVYLKRMFPFWGAEAGNLGNVWDCVNAIRHYGIFFMISIILSTTIPAKYYEKRKDSVIMILLLFVLFWISIYEIANAVNNPFLYFRF